MDAEEHILLETLKHEWMCPIDKAPMKEPVVTSDGYSYEKSAIEHWLKNSDKSPSTNLPLPNKTLIPNLALKNLIDKICSQLPEYLEKEESLKTQIDQLRQEINFLKDELKHQKQKNQELNEKQEKEFKTKKIQKLRHQSKFEQINSIRDQKNQYQRQLQHLRSKEQQQAREILKLKEELKSMTSKFQVASASYRQYFDLFMRVEENRDEVFEKLEFSFVNNFVFIGHLLHSIEKAKAFEKEKQRSRFSQETINDWEDNDEIANEGMRNEQKGVIKRLEEIIRQTVNAAERNHRENEAKYRQIHRFYMNRAARRSRLRRSPDHFSDNEDIYAGLTHSYNPRFFGAQQITQLQLLQGNNLPENPLPTLSNFNYRVGERSNPVNPSLQNSDPNQGNENIEDSEYYRQLLSIKWMMSKRDYKEVPDFYDYNINEFHNKKHSYWYGVKLSVLESRIPFVEFLPYSWNHVRWLDLSACNVDDELWDKFIGASNNFRNLMLLNVRRNKIVNIKRADIEKFQHLSLLDILRNDLSVNSIKEIKEYKTQHPNVKVEFTDTSEANQHQLEWIQPENVF